MRERKCPYEYLLWKYQTKRGLFDQNMSIFPLNKANIYLDAELEELLNGEK